MSVSCASAGSCAIGSSRGLRGTYHAYALAPRTCKTRRLHKLLDTRNHGGIIPRGRSAEAIFDVELPPIRDRSIEELLNLAVQTTEVVKVPLPCIIAAEASIVFIVGIQTELELLANIHAIILKLGLEAPILDVMSDSAVPDTRGDLVCFLGAVKAWPLVEIARFTPVGSE